MDVVVMIIFSCACAPRPVRCARVSARENYPHNNVQSYKSSSLTALIQVIQIGHFQIWTSYVKPFLNINKRPGTLIRHFRVCCILKCGYGENKET